MSRQTKYNLTFNFDDAPASLRGYMIAIALAKSTNAVTGFKQGTPDDTDPDNIRSVKMIRALTKSADGELDIKATSLPDLERLVPQADIKSYYPYRNPKTGDVEMIEIDKKLLSSLYPKSVDMRAIGTVSREQIGFHMLTNYHYFVNCQYDRKSKKIPDRDQKLYNIVFNWLLETGKMLMVKFISGEREKSAIIYPDALSANLRMSLLIPSTYQRDSTVDNLMAMDTKVCMAAGNKLFAGSEIPVITDEMTADNYEERVIAYIEEAKKEGPKKAGLKIKLQPPPAPGVDVIADLLAL